MKIKPIFSNVSKISNERMVPTIINKRIEAVNTTVSTSKGGIVI